MPKIVKFRITNFRGIQSAEIEIDARTNSSVVTLIGLNESGKTTVLEALSHFSTGDRTIPNLLAESQRELHLLSLIPIDRRAAFTGEVRIEATISLSEEERRRYRIAAQNHFLIDIQDDSISNKIVVSKIYRYEDSKYKASTNNWSGLTLSTKNRNKKKYIQYSRPSQNERDKDVWLHIVNNIESEVHELVYFPTFLVNMPDRIYLEAHSDETAINIYYRKIVEDVLRSIDQNLDVSRHIIERVRAVKQESKTPAWLSILFGRPERNLIDSVTGKIEAAINREVIGSWSKVFNQPTSSRMIKVDWNVDSQKDDLVYLTFSITDGSSKYSLSERSLGFRWFFSYLLFTQFRASRNKPTIFLFDEPAANLHAKAQTELIDSIKKIVGMNNKVIYSTHSPHMINPVWLSNAYIIENRAIDFDKSDDILGFDTKPTDIKATKYGAFVSEYPEKKTYFQPVWEKLQYDVPPVIGQGPYLLVEGITDYHLIKYVQNQEVGKFPFDVVPGVGAGNIHMNYSAAVGRGSAFLILLDDDAAGRAEKARYMRLGFLSEAEVVTLGDIDSTMRGKKLESLISDETITKVKARFSGKSGKKQIGMYLAEIAAIGDPDGLSAATLSRISNVLEFALGQFKAR